MAVDPNPLVPPMTPSFGLQTPDPAGLHRHINLKLAELGMDKPRSPQFGDIETATDDTMTSPENEGWGADFLPL